MPIPEPAAAPFVPTDIPLSSSLLTDKAPRKTIRLIVGYPPGGGIDFAARTVQVPLQEALGQQMVVDYVRFYQMKKES